MPRKKKLIPPYYSHPSGDLPLVPHPTLEGRVVACLNGVEIFETDAKLVAWPEPEPEHRPAPEPEPQGDEHGSE